ncbi:MAG: hypothetical protein J6W56_10210 [Prevotella sp.]|nr:hypothetical protein [Prevotella sp.]
MVRGCGCTLVIVSSLVILMALLFAGVIIKADIDAGEEHEKVWEQYRQQVAAYDSIPDVAVRDSLVAELPCPHIRQGGFASIFGIVIGGGVILVALVPFIIGWVLIIINHYKKKRESNYFTDYEEIH